MNQREFSMLAGLHEPTDATEKTLRLCDNEQDAIAVSIAMSGISQAEIARRMGISKGYLTMLKTGDRVLTAKMMAALCSVTGTNLVRQYRLLQSAMRIAQGRIRESDRIAHIASYSMRACA